MRKKTIVSASLSVCLTSGMLIGCSAGQDGKEAMPPEVKKDGTQQVKKELTLNILRWEHPSQAVKQDTPVIREIFKRTGVKVKVESVPQSGYTDKKRALIATNNIPDVILVNQADLNEFGSTGIFLPISDYLDKMPNFQKAIQENPEIKKLYVNGKLYGFPTTAQNNWQYGKALMMRTDILKKLNLAAPTTFDELYNVLREMKKAYPDSYPFSSRGLSFLDAFAFGMGGGYGIYFDPDVDGGKYVYGTNKPAFKKVLTYLNKLYEEKLYDPDFAVLNTQTWGEKNNTSKSFFMYDNNSFALNYNAALQQSGNKDAQFDYIPYLKNDSGKSRGFLYPRGWLNDIYAISSKVKDPEAIIKFYDWLYSPEGVEVSNFGILGETYSNVNGDLKMKDDVIEKYKTAADLVRTMQSDVGAGYLALSPKVDERPLIQMLDPLTVSWIDKIKKDPGAYVWPALTPSLNKDESNQLKEITSQISPIEQDVVKFIMGAKPLSEFDAFASQLEKAGAPKLEKIYNDALSRVAK
ncbi:extracellular solute-binding protein [Paenibacillus thalictri]|uniref:Extracellular solute-binding protein n=1 Tax=Paenibacillus thalictri TaxID=2527873 RepID=A0A4Q9DV17_9BACL|nr:extracellular solute-binding protein [Paenibacillus thalictri]TBL79563.1 extracellular solute-binding protein [Paenibacillus thalictri]